MKPLSTLIAAVIFHAAPLLLMAEEPAKASGAVQVTEVKHTTGKDAKALLEANAAAVAEGRTTKITVLDVRTPAEFAEGHIADAKNMDFKGAEFEKSLGQLDKTKPYLVHCAGGHRSASSLDVFKKLGFKSIIHLDGGLSAWTKEGNPVVK
jgi:rhodanese-related sulfurtransferase